VFDDQLPMGGKWENVEFSFPPIPSRRSHSHSRETSLAIPLPVGFPWDPWKFPYYAHLYVIGVTWIFAAGEGVRL